MLSIKNAGVADIPLIRELSLQVWPPTYNPIIGSGQVAYMLGLFYSPEALEKQMDSGHNFLICYSYKTAVGFASYSETEPGIFKLHKLYTLPSEQGKGTGRYMLGYISDKIRISKGTVLRLNVNRHNHAAKSFYDKAGFKHFREEDIDIGGGYFMNDYVLELVM